MFTFWAGVDQLLSRQVGNDEPELLELIQDVLALADQGEVLWAVDTTPAAPPCSTGSCSSTTTSSRPAR